MTSEVLARKLAVLERYLKDLHPHHGKSVEEAVEPGGDELHQLLVLALGHLACGFMPAAARPTE